MEEEQKRYLQNPDFIYRKIVEEIILVPIHKNVADLNCIYSLNSLGAFIWEQTAKPATLEDLEQGILADYSVDQETARKDLQNYLQEMIAFGAIREV